MSHAPPFVLAYAGPRVCAGETAVLRVDLVRAMRPEQVPPLVEKLLGYKYITRVDTTALNLETEEETEDADAVDVVEFDVPQEETPQGTGDAVPDTDVGSSPFRPQSDKDVP